MDNNYVAKIGVLGPAFPIFAKIMWIMLQNLASWALRVANIDFGHPGGGVQLQAELS
jgi:hypothetical protein